MTKNFFIFLIIVTIIYLIYITNNETFEYEPSLFTCVSGYWRIGNKHGNQYNDWFENTLAINCPYIFFTTEDNIESINNFRKNYPTHYITKNITDFKTYKLNINNITHGEHVPSKELGLVWLEKIDLIREAASLNPYNSEWFCWVDAGICSYRETKPSSNKFPNPEKIHLLSKSLINYSSSDDITDERLSELKNWKHIHKIAGTAYILHISIIDFVHHLFYKYLDKCISETDTYTCYSDQSIWSRIYIDLPTLFNKVGHGYGQIVLELS
jgi:hypothetical protein